MKTAKRFYKNVEVTELDSGWGVTLDGRTLKTPGKQILVVRDGHVARLIAAEWDAQTETIQPETMPVTRLANVSIELTPHNRDKLVDEARRYAGTDLLSYRAESPLELKEQQAAQWDPVLDWAAQRGIRLKTTDAVLAIEQDPEALDKVADYASGLNDLNLTLQVHLTAVFGSAVLSMAVMEKHLTGSQAFDVSRVDNLYQIEQWGEDEEAAEIAAALKAEVKALCQILES